MTKEKYAGDPNKRRSPIPPEFRGLMAEVRLLCDVGGQYLNRDHVDRAISIMRQACQQQEQVILQKELFHEMLVMMPATFRDLVVAIIRLQASIRR